MPVPHSKPSAHFDYTMVELLISAVNKTHPDPETDTKLIKKGDVVTAMPDGHRWGREELNPKKFTIIKVQDLELSEARRLCVPDFESAAGGEPGASGPTVCRARRFMIDENKLAPELRERFRRSRRVGKPLKAARDDIIGSALIDKKAR